MTFAEKELAFPPTVRRVQEWLCLNGAGVVIDGEDGPATQAAVRNFQAGRMIQEKGVGEVTWTHLTSKMRAALAPLAPGGSSLGTMVVRYAQAHLAQHPVEVGGQNRGCWVRLYCQGNDGKEYAWCAGFTSFVLQQACESLGRMMPIQYALGCDFIAGQAKERGLFEDGSKREPEPGWMFLVKRGDKPGFYSHIGVVTHSDGAFVFSTIEGNTTTVTGSSEGFEVCARVRSCKSVDFVRI